MIQNGALLVLDKRERPEVGDTVTLTFTQEYARRWGAPGIVKRLKMALPPPDVALFTGSIVVEQINPPRT